MALRRWLAILPLCGLLGACGGGGTLPGDQTSAPASDPGFDVPTITLTPQEIQTSRTVRPEFAVTRPIYDPETDTITVAIRTLQRVADDLMPAGFAAYEGTTSARRAVRGETRGGHAFAVRQEGIADQTVAARFGKTEMPTLGRGTFTGSYAGTLGTRDAENRGTIVGNASFEVDFGERELSGVIDKRINQNGREFEDLTLGQARIDDQGSFQAFTSGGRSPFLGHTSTDGSYGGLVVGDTGDGLVGGLRVEHSGAPTFVDLIETGAFVAERQ
jgi:hypothetical protein